MLTESLRAAIADLAEKFVKELLETVKPMSLADMLHMAAPNGVSHAVVPVPRAAERSAYDDDEDAEQDDEVGPPTTRSPGLAKAKAKAARPRTKRTERAKKTPAAQESLSLQLKEDDIPIRTVSLSRARRRTSTSVEVVQPDLRGEPALGPYTSGMMNAGGRPAVGVGGVADRIVEVLRRHPKGLRAEELKNLLHLDRMALKRGLADVLEANRVIKQGVKRATTYFARG